MTFKYSKIQKELNEMVTQLNEAHQYIYQLTYYDPLTKLPNRQKLKDTFNQSLDDPNPKIRPLPGVFLST